MNLSAVILTKNESNKIENCLRSLGFCDEIIVIDDYSTDGTSILASRLGCKVYRRHLNANFANQRNFGLGKAGGKWVLFIDADERVTDELEKEIIQFVNDPTINFNGLYIKRQDVLWGRKFSSTEAGEIKLLRLAKKGFGIWQRRVHEFWDVSGDLYTLKNKLMHFPHPNLREFIKDINWMSSLHAIANFEEGKRSSLFKIIFWPIGKFIQNWVIKSGYKDKTFGFVLSAMMSLHSFLAWSKLWIIQKKKVISG